MSEDGLYRSSMENDAADSLKEMMEALRKEGPHIKVSFAKLNSVIVTEYKAEHFDRRKPELLKIFIDKRAYLKELVEKTDENDLISTLQEKLTDLSKKKTLKKPNDVTNELVR